MAKAMTNGKRNSKKSTLNPMSVDGEYVAPVAIEQTEEKTESAVSWPLTFVGTMPENTVLPSSDEPTGQALADSILDMSPSEVVAEMAKVEPSLSDSILDSLSEGTVSLHELPIEMAEPLPSLEQNDSDMSFLPLSGEGDSISPLPLPLLPSSEPSATVETKPATSKKAAGKSGNAQKEPSFVPPLTIPDMVETVKAMVEAYDNTGTVETWKPEGQKGTQIDLWETLLASEIGRVFATVPYRVKAGWGWIGTQNGIDTSKAAYDLIQGEIRKSTKLSITPMRTPERLAYFLEVTRILLSDMQDVKHPRTEQCDRHLAETVKAAKLAFIPKTYQLADGGKVSVKIYQA